MLLRTWRLPILRAAAGGPFCRQAMTRARASMAVRFAPASTNAASVLCSSRKKPETPTRPLAFASQKKNFSSRSSTDPYVILGVSRGLSDKEYRVAYLKAAKQCHPDMNPDDPAATARFQKLSVAYDSIKTAAARAQYERQREQNFAGGFGGASGGFGGGGPGSQERAQATWSEAFADADAMLETLKEWWDDELQEIDEDMKEFSSSIRNRRFGDAYVVMQKRSGLIFGVVVPLLVLLRWPGAALAVLRGAAPIFTFAVGITFRVFTHNPALLRQVTGILHRFASRSWQDMAARARARKARSRKK